LTWWESPRVRLELPRPGTPLRLCQRRDPCRMRSSFDGNDAESFWPVSAILKRALEMSPNLRVINPSQVLGALRRRGLVEGYFGNYRRLAWSSVVLFGRRQMPNSDDERYDSLLASAIHSLAMTRSWSWTFRSSVSPASRTYSRAQPMNARSHGWSPWLRAPCEISTPAMCQD
jgi:hypothetical protein